MSLHRSAIALFALSVSLAFPAAAGALPLVPPGNSAAMQYTETFPAAGGNVEVNGSIGGGTRPAAKVLGARTAHALESRGEEGQAVAALAAESPAPRSHAKAGLGGGGSGGSAGGGGGSGVAGGGRETAEVGGTDSGPARAGQPSGSSGAGEVLSHVTLSSSGEMGIFLPLVLLAALVWALLYGWRRRERRLGA